MCVRVKDIRADSASDCESKRDLENFIKLGNEHDQKQNFKPCDHDLYLN